MKEISERIRKALDEGKTYVDVMVAEGLLTGQAVDQSRVIIGNQFIEPFRGIGEAMAQGIGGSSTKITISGDATVSEYEYLREFSITEIYHSLEKRVARSDYMRNPDIVRETCCDLLHKLTIQLVSKDDLGFPDRIEFTQTWLKSDDFLSVQLLCKRQIDGKK